MKETSIIALDVGETRVGVARANSETGFPQPLTTLLQDNTFWDNLHDLLEIHNAVKIVVGLPRNLSGEDTLQTVYTRNFVEILKQKSNLPIYMQDEAGTSKQAEQELLSKKKPFAKSDIDALAATYILEDFLASKGVISEV